MVVNDLEKYLKNEAKKINTQLKNFFPRKITKKWILNAFDKIDFELDEKTLSNSISVPIWDFLDRGGKRWRPTLMLLSCKAVLGKEKNALPLTLIPELAHTGSIIVDDVEDNTFMRRGKPALHKIYGIDLAINDGNLLYFLPLILLFKNKKISDRNKIRFYDVYAQEMLKLSFGQSLDIFWHQGKKVDVREEQYLQMCAFKTGSLSSMAAKFGAIIGGGSKQQISSLGEFASIVGIAFQIQDDILNISNSKKLGKEFGDDIKEGKRSLPIIHALNNAPKKDSTKLLKILNSHTSKKQKLLEAVEIIKKTGSITYSKKIAQKLVKKSWVKLNKQLSNTPAKKKLFELKEFLIYRKL